jgi:hypothetical protein
MREWCKKTRFLFVVLFVALGQGIFNLILTARCTPRSTFSQFPAQKAE